MRINKQKIANILDKAIETILMAIIILIPLYFTFLYKDNSIFNVPKAAVFRILVEIGLILYLIKVLIEKKISIFAEKKHFLLISAFFIALLIATVFSIDQHNSFWGSYFRQQGLYTYLHYFAFAFLITATIKSRQHVICGNYQQLLSFIIWCYAMVWDGFFPFV